MPPGTPPLQFNHQLAQQIPTKHKEAIRQLYGFAKIPIEGLIAQYKLGRSIITKILEYEALERSRVSRTGRPSLLTDKQVDEIIEYAAESWEHKVLNFQVLHDELKLECFFKTLKKRLK